jgi:carboxyl-terminal processing protease
MKKLITLITFCTILFNLQRASAQMDTVSNISDADKLFGLSKFWSEASYNFAYFDHAKINWDSTYRAFIPKILATKSTWQYYLQMARFAALLKDGHTDMGYVPDLQRKPRSRWMLVENFDKHFYVTDIAVQYKDMVPLGSEIISIDGIQLQTYVENELMPYICSSTEYVKWNIAARCIFLNFAPDTSQVWHLQLRTPKGKMIGYNYQYHTYDPKWERRNTLTKTPLLEYKDIKGVAYVKLNSFSDQAIVDSFKKILPQLYASKGVILDVRLNGGGSSGIGAGILDYFTNDKMLMGSKWRTREHLASFKAWGVGINGLPSNDYKNWGDFGKKVYLVTKGDYWYDGDTSKFQNAADSTKKITCPLVVLTSNSTASAAEDFLIILSQMKGRAVTMGQRTYGSTGQPLNLDLPGIKYARICTKRDTYPDGRDFVGVGVIPDIEIPRDVNDVINGTDKVLNAALVEINQKIK